MKKLSRTTLCACNSVIVRSTGEMLMEVSENSFSGLATVVMMMDSIINHEKDPGWMRTLYYIYKSMDLSTMKCTTTTYLEEIQSWFEALNEEFKLEH